MKTNVNLWWILTGFFLLVTAVYTGWNIIEYPERPIVTAIEWVGTVGFLFVAFMSAMIGWYLHRTQCAEGDCQRPVGLWPLARVGNLLPAAASQLRVDPAHSLGVAGVRPQPP